MFLVMSLVNWCIAFSIYVSIKIFSADPSLIPLLKYYYYVPLRIEQYHQQRVLQLIQYSLTNHLCILEKGVDEEDPCGTPAFTGNHSEI